MSVGLWQILIVVALLLLLFGRGRISQSMADLAKGIRAFRHGLKDEEDVVQTHERDSDSDTQPQKTTPFFRSRRSA